MGDKMFNFEKIVIPKEFGDLGGILVPDSFIPDINDFAKKAEKILGSEAFKKAFFEIKKYIPLVSVRETYEDDIKILLSNSITSYYVISGHLIISKLVGSDNACVGIERKDLAVFASKVAARLGISLTIILSRELSTDTELKKELKKQGSCVDDVVCTKLYNRPQAYAFQRFIGDRKHTSFIATGCELGCYPFPGLSGHFASLFGNDLREAISGKEIDAAVVITKYGNGVIACLRTFDNNVKIISIEEPICQSFAGEYCGASLIFERSAKEQEYNHPVSPELVDAWKMGRVIELGKGSYIEIEGTETLSAAAKRALLIVRKRLPELKNVMIVEGGDE